MSDVVLLERIHDAAEVALGRAGLTIARVDGGLSGQPLIDAIATTRFLGIRSKSHVNADVIGASPSLEAIGCFCIGTNQVDLEAAAAAGVVVFNSPFSNTRSVAELTIAETIALQRRLFDRSMSLHGGHWSKSASGAHEVRGRTIGIVGYGHIGSQVSVLAEAMGMRVLYHDVLPRMALGNAQPCDSLAELLRESDVVTLHVPATATTKNLIDAKAIARMKQGASVINNARGSVVDLAALRVAIESGHISGAAIDVFPEEPGSNDEPFECPLAGCPNVILTPHVGGSTEEAQAQIATDVATKLSRYAATGTTSSAVNVPEVDLPDHQADQARILHFHRNVPGVLSALHTIIADSGANIHAEYLQSHGDLSYVILDIDRVEAAAVGSRIAALPETIRYRILG